METAIIVLLIIQIALYTLLIGTMNKVVENLQKRSKEQMKDVNERRAEVILRLQDIFENIKK